MGARKKIRRMRSDAIFVAIVYVVLSLLLLVVAYPLWFVIIASVSDPAAVSFGRVILVPSGFSLEGYQQVITYPMIWRSYLNTICYTVCDVLLTTTITVLAGYALSRGDLVGKKGIVVYFTITMFFSGGLIPTYLTVKSLGLVGVPAVVFLLGCVGVRNIIIVRTFIQGNIPESLVEAAFLDGCNHTRFLLKIVAPLSMPVISVIVLFTAVGQWNSWFNAMIYLTEDTQMPLQMVLRNLLISQTSMMQDVLETSTGDDSLASAQLALSMRYALIIVATLPIMCVYPFLQRYFVKGMTMGSIKG